MKKEQNNWSSWWENKRKKARSKNISKNWRRLGLQVGISSIFRTLLEHVKNMGGKVLIKLQKKLVPKQLSKSKDIWKCSLRRGIVTLPRRSELSPERKLKYKSKSSMISCCPKFEPSQKEYSIFKINLRSWLAHPMKGSSITCYWTTCVQRVLHLEIASKFLPCSCPVCLWGQKISRRLKDLRWTF